MLKRLGIAAFCLALAATALSSLYVAYLLSSPQHPSHPADNRTTNQQPPDSTNQIVAPVSGEERIADYTQALATWTTVLGVATLGLFVATVAIGIIQYRGFRATQRANVSVEPLGIDPMANWQSVAHVGIRNAGNLPASQLKWLVTYTFGPRRIPALPDLEMKDLRGDNILVPGSSMVQGSKLIKYPPNIRQEISNLFIYIYGIVIYHDGFRRRETRFCHRYNCAVATFNPPNGPLIGYTYARYYHEGNSAT